MTVCLQRPLQDDHVMAAVGGSRTREADVMIIGAGPAGILTAHALQMRGLSVIVFEQDASLDARPRDWNFGIYWAQVPLKECLPEHLRSEVENAQIDDHRAGEDEIMPIRNGQTGELLKAVPIPHNIRLARKRFLRLISQGLNIQYSKRFTSLSSTAKSATAAFADGTSFTGTLLISAEGAHSLVREFVVGPEKAPLVPLPLVASSTLATLPAHAALKFKQYATRLMVLFHPSGYFNWIGLHSAHSNTSPGEWTFMLLMSWVPDASYDPSSLETPSQILNDMKTRAQIFAPDIHEIWDSILPGTKCWHNRLSYWYPPAEPSTWDNHSGTVTLLGDAAHAMTFHRGQGLNNAIMDAALLAKKVEENGGLGEEAVKAYEAEMIPRAREAVMLSNENSLAVHEWDKLMSSPLFTQGLKQKSG